MTLRIAIFAAAIGTAVSAPACGIGGGGVALEDPTPTIFPEAAAAPIETETTTSTAPASSTTTQPLAERLPALESDGLAKVIVTGNGIVAPVRAHTPDGWIVQTPCENEVALSDGTPVYAAHVVIDPGHGGSESGAVGEGGLVEADLNLEVAELVAEELQQLGVSVVLTRLTDDRYTLATRALIATTLGADAFVSIHHNAAPDGPSDRPGSETWYQIGDDESRRLAGLVYEEVVAALEQYDVDWVADTDAGAKYRLNQRGTDYYGILRNSVGVPAVLAELAFISNPAEEQLLSTTEVRQVEAEAVVAGVVRFLTSDDPGSGFVEPYERITPAGPGGGLEGCVDPELG